MKYTNKKILITVLTTRHLNVRKINEEEDKKKEKKRRSTLEKLTIPSTNLRRRSEDAKTNRKRLRRDQEREEIGSEIVLKQKVSHL